MSGSCATCPPRCGRGRSNPSNRDPDVAVLCRIFCEVRRDRCAGRLTGSPSSAAEQRARQARGLSGTPAVNQTRYVRYDNMPRSWGRTPVSAQTVQRHLSEIESQIRRRGAQMMATRAGQAAARSWMRVVPVLNVVSTAYDIYSLGSAGVDIVRDIRQARQAFSGDVYRIRPDVAIQNPQTGNLEKVFDFKFEGDRPRNGQTQIYDRALENAGSNNRTTIIDQQSCRCDGPASVTGPMR